MRVSRLILCVFGACLAGALALAVLLPGVARADTVSFSVQGQQFSFDTGDGRDGDVELQRQGDVVKIFVNGTERGQLTTSASLNPGSTLAISTSSTYANLTSAAWVPSSGYEAILARFTGTTQSYDYGYIDVYVVNNWVQLAQFSGSWDRWIVLPQGTTQLRVRLTTSSYSGSRSVSVPEVIAWPSSVRATATQSLNSALYLQATSTNQSLTGGPWSAPQGRYILAAQFKGNTRSGQHYGYLDVYVNGVWQQVVQRSGTWDEVLVLPVGASQIRVRLTTNSQSLVSPTYVDVPAVSLGNAVVSNGQTSGLSNALYASTTSTNQNIVKEWWASPGKTVTSVRFRGNTYSGQHYGYLYVYTQGGWRLIDQRSGTWDFWLAVPTGIRGLRVQLTTNSYTPISSTYVDVPEVSVWDGVTIDADTQTVLRNVMELDGRDLSQRSDQSFISVKMETLAPYLPSTKTYAPQPTAGSVSTGNALKTTIYSANQDVTKEWRPSSGLSIRRVRFSGYNASYTSGYDYVTYYYNYLYAEVNGAWVLVDQRNGGSYDYWVTLPRGTTAIRTRITTGSSSYYGYWVDAPEVVLGYPAETLPASLGTIPQFNTLTVGTGVMLTADTHVAFKVRDTLTVRGVILSGHGQGAPATSSSAVHGEDAKGDVVILAGNVVVAPEGNTGESGAVLAGWGGGGGGYGSSAGNGGSGGNVYIYASRVVNRGEIRAGNGGGGGAWSQGSDSGYSGYGRGGYGGNTVLIASVLEGGGVIASGLSGTDGGNYSNTSGYAGAGYGGGGISYYYSDPYTSYWVNGPGGTGGNRGGGYGSFPGGAGFAGTSGYYGNKTVGYSRDDGALTVKVGRLVEISGIPVRLYVGYTSGGWMGGLSYYPSQDGYVGIRARKTIWIDSIVGNPVLSIGAGMYVLRNWDRPIDVVSVNDSIVLGTPQAPVNVTIQDLYFTYLTVNGNATFTGNLYFTPGTVVTTGDAYFAPSSYIYAKSGVPGRFQAGGAMVVQGNIEQTRWYTLRLGYAGGSGNLWTTTYVSFTASGDVRFRGRPEYTNASWWRSTDYYGNYYRTVIANGITVSLVRPAASVSGFGATVLTFGNWVTNYGGLGQMEFRAERKPEGGSWAVAGTFIRALTGTPEWYDVNTPLRQNLYYRVGFRAVGAATGFVWLDDVTVGPIYSEGAALADEEPPQIQVFAVNGGISPATVRYVSAELVATDNRTQADQLLVQFEVGGQKRYFDGNVWQAGDGWGPYRQAYDSLDLGQTSGLVKVTVRVKDIAGNVGTAVAQVDLRLDTGYVATGTVTVAGAVAGTYDGLPVLFVRSEKVTLSLGFSGATHVRFGLDGQPFSEWEAYSAQRVVALPKSSGLVVLTVQARDASRYFEPQKLYLVVDGQPPSITRLQGLNGATATRTSSVTLEIYATDNLSGTLQYRYQVNGGAWSSWGDLTGGTIPVAGLVSGANRITVEVKDAAGNTAQAAVTIFRI